MCRILHGLETRVGDADRQHKSHRGGIWKSLHRNFRARLMRWVRKGRRSSGGPDRDLKDIKRDLAYVESVMAERASDKSEGAGAGSFRMG